MKFFPDITKPLVSSTTASESGRLADYGPSVGFEPYLVTYPLGSGHYSWASARLDDELLASTSASDDSLQTVYDFATDVSTPDWDSTFSHLSDLIAANNPAWDQFLPLLNDASSVTYNEAFRPSYEEVLEHTDIHNYTGNMSPHTILGPYHSDRNNPDLSPGGLMAYTLNTFGKLPASSTDNQVVVTASSEFTQAFPISDLNGTGRVHGLTFSGTGLGTVSNPAGDATVEVEDEHICAVTDGTTTATDIHTIEFEGCDDTTVTVSETVNGIATVTIDVDACASDCHICSVSSGANTCTPVHTLDFVAGDYVTIDWCNTTANEVELTINACNSDSQIDCVTDGTNCLENVTILEFSDTNDATVTVSGAGSTATVTIDVDFDCISTDDTWIQNCTGTITHVGPSTCHSCENFVTDVEPYDTWDCDQIQVWYKDLAWDCLGHVVGTFNATCSINCSW